MNKPGEEARAMEEDRDSLLPAYLREAPQTGHIYGTLSYNRRSKCWTI